MTDPDSFSVRVLARTTIATDTVAFFLERPAGFEFEAGQFVSVQLVDFDAPEDGSDDGERMLSIASAPHDPQLMIAMRMRDTPFKRHLSACAIGSDGASVSLSPAMGDFVLPTDPKQPLVMLAGGIGITPFFSMLRHLQHEAACGKPTPPATLLYGNRTHDLAAWRDELARLCAELPSLRVVHVIAEEDAEASHLGDEAACVSRAGLITADVICQEVPEWQASRYYIVGPTAMVAAMQDCLDACGVPPEQVAIEFFAGY